MEVTQPVRYFKIHNRVVEDLAPHMPFAESVRMLKHVYALARPFTLDENVHEVQSDGSLLYLLDIPAKHNG